jgi:hypothetical protein
VLGLPGDPLRGPVPGARLVGRDAGVGNQLDGRADNRARGGVEHDRAVHLGQLAQPGRGELDVQLEPARTQIRHRLVEAEHDERTRATSQNPLQAIP